VANVAIPAAGARTSGFAAKKAEVVLIALDKTVVTALGALQGFAFAAHRGAPVKRSVLSYPQLEGATTADWAVGNTSAGF
jgi:hypothetical protein